MDFVLWVSSGIRNWKISNFKKFGASGKFLVVCQVSLNFESLKFQQTKKFFKLKFCLKKAFLNGKFTTEDLSNGEDLLSDFYENNLQTKLSKSLKIKVFNHKNHSKVFNSLKRHVRERVIRSEDSLN